MKLAGLLPLIQQSTAYKRTLNRLWTPQGGDSAFSLRWPLLDAARPAILGALQQDWVGPLLVLTAQPERAHFLQEQVSVWSTRAPSWYFPAPDALFYDRTPWDGETIHRRVSVLSALASQDYARPPILFTSVWALMTQTIPPALLASAIRTIHVGQKIRLSDLAGSLVGSAYEPVPVVEEAGTFAQRGGILDVFPPNMDQPVRIEWFGDEIETLRRFDPLSQRSLEPQDRITLYPASEALAHYEPALQYLEHLPAESDSPALARWQRDRERLPQNSYFRGAEFYLACLHPHPATLLDYLPPHLLLIVDDMAAVEDAARNLEQQALDIRAELVESGQLTADLPSAYLPWDELSRAIDSLPGIHLGQFSGGGRAEQKDDSRPAAGNAAPAELTAAEEDPSFHVPLTYAGRIERLVEDTVRLRAEHQRVVIVSRQAQRLSNLFAEHGETVAPVEDILELPPAGSLTVVQGSLAEGWSLCDPQPRHSRLPLSHTPAITLLSDAEIFGWVRPKRRSFTRKRAASPESFFSELHVGDAVVHIDHGIGIYRGLVHKVVDGTPREFIELEYAEGDRVYVPVSQMDRVSRYVGASDQPPAVHRLGSGDWIQARSRAQKAVQEIARELLALYAARSVVPGHRYSPDVLWQEELEASFPYEETEDQLRALGEVKADMESSRPMDRLICGDVGYGKTEVAVRAAFKAVMDGKQAAVLVPTTVLAQQHLLTFQQRLAAFPVRVSMLSRFCSPREAQTTVEGLREGTVDVVVGTHRLLQKDVSFHDLGLLIVDEEQRFGVRHKEWLKQMRQQVDVLTLTATPIPRTLYMAMSGVRDMSTIDTPPEERLPIRTQVSEYDEGVIRRAILRELNRGGQVYFVHNRVQGIRQIAQRLQKIVPEATITIGHGQMPEDKLSNVMMDFARGDYDVLVCTSIIESGLDIPNVNTIIINRADQFGLAQLYQLRGRVGRSAAQAYAYLLHEKRLRLSDVARRRLEAILEASELGAGFRIAMRDLEIRGAGEILGATQHGHIAAIGFELYTRLLAQAVETLKRARPAEKAELPPVELPPVIELPLQAYLPDDYVEEEDLRIRLYQRMTSLQSEEELDSLRGELEDRFGLLPSATENLLYVLRVRLLASRAGVLAVGRADNSLVLKLNQRAQERASAMVARFGRRAWVGRGQMWLALAEDQTDWQDLLLALLERLGEAPAQHGRAQ
ncbi:MAG TPA: transcription-repair coupling factor [Anaerolineae bacterium]|nr:transcription-repair coupling factor [Anaerolineae bacterium]HQJ50845.1 transcription-repair coupling factor [Anaerolineae bacterium]